MYNVIDYYKGDKMNKILTKEDIANLQSKQKNEIILHEKKLKKIGVGLILLFICIGLMIGFGFTVKPEESKINFIRIVNITLGSVGICIFFLPNLVKESMQSYYLHMYSEANEKEIHNCKAYVNMPGMEYWKEYIEEIKKQNRQLTNHECNLLIDDWIKLINKS